MISACKAQFPDYDGAFDIGYAVLEKAPRFTTFWWGGVQWASPILLTRLFWVAAAIGIALLAALFFDRFDPARRKSRRSERTSSAEEAESSDAPPATHAHLPALAPAVRRFAFSRMLAAELRLMLRGLRWWWFACAAGLLIGCLVAPLDVARQWLLPFAWIWPLTIFSAMGTREVRNDTGQIIFSTPRPLGRLLPATWAAGVIVAAVAGSGVALRSLIAGQWRGLGGWLVGALFIPTLAVALGVWSASPKLFEAVYTILWYIGPVNQFPQLDFMGASKAALSRGSSVPFLIATAALLVLAYLGRKRQLGSLAG